MQVRVRFRHKKKKKMAQKLSGYSAQYEPFIAVKKPNDLRKLLSKFYQIMHRLFKSHLSLLRYNAQLHEPV